MNFGAFVEILPGKEGLVHISQLSTERVGKVELNSPQYQTLTLFIQILPFFCEFSLFLQNSENEPDEKRGRE